MYDEHDEQLDEYSDDNPRWLQQDREEWGDGYDGEEVAQKYASRELAGYDGGEY